jgi:hypothetical protein
LAFVGQFAGTAKEPDCALMLDGRNDAGIPPTCPLWVNECEYSETLPALPRDMTKWLNGTNFGVRFGIETKFNKRSASKVAGIVILHSNQGANVVQRVHASLIF